jgi:reticulon-4-interacting protein 1, mitochondrial
MTSPLQTTPSKSWTYTTAPYPSTLIQTTQHVPSTPAAQHLLVAVRAASVNPVDIQMMNLPIWRLPGRGGPKIAGRDFSGVVIAAAADTGFAAGDEVIGITLASNGAGFLTEIAHVDLRITTVVKKPPHLDFVRAASVPLVWLTAQSMLARCESFRGAAGSGGGSGSPTTTEPPRLAILGGSSAVGMYAIGQAKARGWRVLATCSGRNAEFVRGLGADEVADYTVSAGASAEAVRGFRPDAVLDCVGGTACLGLAPQYVTIVGDKLDRAVLGGSLAYLTSPRMVVRWLLGRLSLGPSYECISLDIPAAWLREADGLQDKDVVIDSVYDLDQTMEAFERLNTGRARGKVVVQIPN